MCSIKPLEHEYIINIYMCIYIYINIAIYSYCMVYYILVIAVTGFTKTGCPFLATLAKDFWIESFAGPGSRHALRCGGPRQRFASESEGLCVQLWHHRVDTEMMLSTVHSVHSCIGKQL